MLLFCHSCSNYFYPEINRDTSNSSSSPSFLKCNQCQSEVVEIIPDDQPDLFTFPLQFAQRFLHQERESSSFSSEEGATSSTQETFHHSTDSSELEDYDDDDDDGEHQLEEDSASSSQEHHRRTASSHRRAASSQAFGFPLSALIGGASGALNQPVNLHQLFSFLRMLSRQRTGEINPSALEGWRRELASMWGIHGDPRDYAFGGEEYNAILQQLFEQASAQKEAKPASDHTIAQLERLRASSKSNHDDDETTSNGNNSILPSGECNICKDTFGEEMLVRLGCGHVFHEECCLGWLRVNGSCPICRRIVDDDDAEEKAKEGGTAENK